MAFFVTPSLALSMRRVAAMRTTPLYTKSRVVRVEALLIDSAQWTTVASEVSERDANACLLAWDKHLREERRAYTDGIARALVEHAGARK